MTDTPDEEQQGSRPDETPPADWTPPSTEPPAARATAPPVKPVAPVTRPATPVVPLPPLAQPMVPAGPSIWPVGSATATPAALIAALAAGVVGMFVMPLGITGIGYFLTGLAIAAAAAVAGQGWLRNPAQAVAAALTLLLLVVLVFRDAPWLAVLCILTALGVASLALAGGSRWPGLLLGTLVMGAAAPLSLVWAGRGLINSTRNGNSRGALRGAAVAVVTIVLLLVFGALFASADVVFGNLVDSVLPDLSVETLPARIFFLFLVTAMALAAATVASVPPRFDGLADGPPRPVRRYEWLVPLALLDALFAIFVVVQVSAVLGGHGHVLRTAGLTYAEYARRGFAQLVVVTMLTLAVLAIAARKAPRETRTDRILVRVLLGALAVLALAIAVSALRRMHLYEEAYGATRLRLLVAAFEVWLCVLFAFVLAAGVRLRANWLPRATVATGVAMLLALAVLNPDRWIAEHNVGRDKVDLSYLSTLSADAVPTLDRLPEPQRSCALRAIAEDAADRDPWYGFNLARHRARQLLAARPPQPDVDCDEIMNYR